ncbi:pilus assembly protein [Dyella sp. C9]|uniref:pilus assembly protein n=1 Tax=Dyella sp. C9 TaxID=2202154 RepID=UPI001E5486DA|nr:PilC/PilY family type IV pilus protein [Dyella sp. C9]
MARFLGRLLSIGLLVCILGVLSEPSHAAGTKVTVDTSPLIQQPSVPPNIVLMLDDSGSMAWNFMPDICYLNGVTCGTDKNGNPTSLSKAPTNSALINAANNGVYYNPAVTYSAPPKADGTFYNVSTTLTSAVVDGFTNIGTTVDLTQYALDSSCSSSSPYTCTANYESWSSGGNNGTKASNIAFSHVISSGSKKYYYFQFSVGAATSTSPAIYYVASTAQGCVSVPSTATCVTETDISGKAAPSGVAAGTNIANWFTYYRTRILMAKSGLMTAFSSLNANYRVGFGSIDGGNGNGNSNYVNLPGGGSPPSAASGADSKLYPYTDTYNKGTNWIALVQPFGDGTKSTDQKTAFWTWVSNVKASGGTPLRQALNAVGTYYMQDQPWSTMSTDPNPTNTTELACRQAYTILTTDGFWNETNSPGAGNFDGTSATTAITGPNQQSYTYTAVAPYSDSQSDTLADVAMKYWATDLRGNTANEVPINGEDAAFWQHMVTFTMGLGFTPTNIKPSGTTVDQIFSWANNPKNPPSWAGSFSWPVPSSDSINNIADLAHAAVNGHGGFYSATSPTSFSNGLADALQRATARNGSGSSLAANSTQLQSGTYAYQASYYTSKWTGDLMAYQIDSTTGAIATAPDWKASAKLPAAASRNIYTYNTSAGTYLAFSMSGSALPALSTAQLTALGGTTAAQTSMINYLRGDQTNEQSQTSGIYRTRESLIGDIVNSQPVYVGAPVANQFLGESSLTGVSAYAAYANAKSSRTGTIYVAANDGFLHAFNASSGAETYAYLPGAVIANGSAGGISDLSKPSYGADSLPHQYFNDGEVAVADVYMNNAWKTVLVGTTGRGLAKAVYALDVTDPANIQFLWERSATDGAKDGNSQYIGQMTGKPVIAQTGSGTWSVLIGNGYNSAAGKAALLQFALADGTLSAYATTDSTGLAAPGVWIGSPTTGVSTVAYAGDLDGHVWSFDLSSSGSSGTLLFTATDASKNPQPITAGILVGKNPQTNDVWLFFGTGKYLTTADLSDASVQTWYGLIATAASAGSTAITAQTDQTRNKLVQRYITAETGSTATTSAGRTVTTAAQAASMTGLSGWYMDLQQPVASTDANGNAKTTYNNQGERMVTPNQFQGSYLLGTTRIPNSSDPCNPSGSGWVMAVDPFTGTNPQSNFFDLNHDGKVNASDSINGTPSAGIAFTSLPNNPIFTGGSMLMSFDNGTTGSIQTAGGGNTMTRVSWRELIAQ